MVRGKPMAGGGPVEPIALPGVNDELDRTAQQVRLDYDRAVVHKVAETRNSVVGGRYYRTRCNEALTAAEGAILTTYPVGCYWCLTGGTRPNR